LTILFVYFWGWFYVGGFQIYLCAGLAQSEKKTLEFECVLFAFIMASKSNQITLYFLKLRNYRHNYNYDYIVVSGGFTRPSDFVNALP
jgi:hypothetical protein